MNLKDKLSRMGEYLSDKKDHFLSNLEFAKLAFNINYKDPKVITTGAVGVGGFLLSADEVKASSENQIELSSDQFEAQQPSVKTEPPSNGPPCVPCIEDVVREYTILAKDWKSSNILTTKDGKPVFYNVAGDTINVDQKLIFRDVANLSLRGNYDGQVSLDGKKLTIDEGFLGIIELDIKRASGGESQKVFIHPSIESINSLLSSYINTKGELSDKLARSDQSFLEASKQILEYNKLISQLTSLNQEISQKYSSLRADYEDVSDNLRRTRISLNPSVTTDGQIGVGLEGQFRLTDNRDLVVALNAIQGDEIENVDQYTLDMGNHPVTGVSTYKDVREIERELIRAYILGSIGTNISKNVTLSVMGGVGAGSTQTNTSERTFADYITGEELLHDINYSGESKNIFKPVVGLDAGVYVNSRLGFNVRAITPIKEFDPQVGFGIKYRLNGGGSKK